VVLLSHAHGDHIGDQKMKALEAGTCANPEVVSAAPNSTTADIAAAKNAALVMVVPLANFIGRKIENIRGKPTPACPQAGDARSTWRSAASRWSWAATASASPGARVCVVTRQSVATNP